jgi:hypothetical protein
VTAWNPRRWTTIADAAAHRSNCFVNAGLAAQRYGFRYCEGYATL